MKRFTSLGLILLLCGQMAIAQESNCLITGTILSEQTGQPLPGIVVIVHKVYKARKLLRSVPQKFRTNPSGVFSFSLVRGAVALIETQVEGFNVPGGVSVQIPSAASATLETLQRVTMPEQVPVAVPTESGAPVDAAYITKTPNAVLTNEQALSSLATGLVKNTTGSGVLSIAGAVDLPSGIAAPKISGGNVSNAEFDALDGATGPIQPQLDSLQSQINGKAALSHPHAGTDITSGVINPSRLGSGTPDASKVLFGNGTWGTAPSGAPGGSNKQIQINQAGAFAGATGFEYQGAASPNLLMVAQNAAHVPFAIRGAASQSTDLFQVQQSDAQKRLFVDSGGSLNIQNATGELWFDALKITSQGYSTTTAIVQGSNFQIRAGGNKINLMNANGANNAVNFNLNYPDQADSTPRLEILALGVNDVGMVIKAFASHTANLSEWKNSSNANMLAVTATGAMDLAEQSSPSNPAADHLKVFAKDVSGQSELFIRRSDGSEQQLGAGGGGAASYDIAGGINGLPDPNEFLMIFPAVRSTTLPASLTGAQGYAITAGTASVTFTIYRRASGTTTDSQLGTMVFSAGSRTATFTVTDAGQLALSAGDILLVKSPGTQDATLANIGFVFKIN